MSDAQTGGRDFNLMVRKDRKGAVRLQQCLGQTTIDLEGEVNFVYNCSRA